ncbi:nif-specific transcriptional activator NifA [Acidocella sp.]|uniref:nif-specific transcriptional activator NifA n=1 Tax=Acidocella sp. TaxID=50710 RepID=UPI00178DE1EB|nr:nif-specific transcriptional activator NifA [Acidocella sp.]NNM57793.1 nif-specific transcriptional activator NifA [Acidocella sp.]
MQIGEKTKRIAAADSGVSAPGNTGGAAAIPGSLGHYSTRAEIALHGVYEVSKVLASPARLETTLSNVLGVLSSFMDMHHGIIALLNADGLPDIAVGSGWSEENAKHHFSRLPERAVGQIVTTKMPVVIENIKQSSLFAGWWEVEWGHSEALVSFIGVPIKVRDKVIGTITLDRVWDRHATFGMDQDVRFLAMIANLVGQTIRLYDVVGRDRERLMTEQRRLEKELSVVAKGERAAVPSDIIGESQAIRAVIEKIGVVARSHSTVLLRGESGTGKELFARATHDLSPRHAGPFIKVNCAALPESMLESELFGHEKGAFTGAIAQRKGRFELADGGTLFLDEIGEISPAFQAKLLRVLQEGEFERVGGMKTIKINVRLVTATNKNLEEAVAKGEFRADLYYRINVVSILLPPLRSRSEDIAPLAREFLRRFNTEHGTELSLGPQATRLLKECGFPGNVRELENCVRRTATLARHQELVADDFACRHDECLSATLWRGAVVAELFNILPPENKRMTPPPAGPAGPEPVIDPTHCPQVEACRSLNSEPQMEREQLVQAMEATGWVQAKAARLLKLTPRQIGYALRKHNIPIKRF